MKTIKVGIIGAGGIARSAHIPSYQKLEDVSVVAVADVIEATAKEAAEKYKIPNVLTNYEDLLKIEEIDAVSVCTPNAFHAAPSIAAMEAGKHVLCEKPMAISVKEARQMVETANKHKRILQIGLASRFSAGAQFLKQQIETGRLGEIYFARAVSIRRRGIPSWGVFVRKEMSGGGALLDIGVHVIDLVVWLMGAPKPTAVFGTAGAMFGKRRDVINPDWGPWDVDRFDVDDFATGMVRFENGAMLSIETAWAANIEEPGRSYILGTDGGCHIVGDKIFEQRNGKLSDTPLKIPEGESAYYVEVQRFVDAIRNDLPSPVPPEEVLNVQQIINGIYESAETGESVRIR